MDMQVWQVRQEIVSDEHRQEDEVVEALKDLARQIIGAKLKDIGWRIEEEDDETLQQFRSLLFEHAGAVGVKE